MNIVVNHKEIKMFWKNISINVVYGLEMVVKRVFSGIENPYKWIVIVVINVIKDVNKIE